MARMGSSMIPFHSGRDFAAKYADSIITLADGIEGMKEYRDDIRARARMHGRNPDDLKVLYLVVPTLAETKDEAYAKRDRFVRSQEFMDQTCGLISAITDIDFSKYDLDSPLPHLTTNGEQGSLDKFQQWGSNKTLRELIHDSAEFASSIELLDTPDGVAERMAEIIEEVGGDGFLSRRTTSR
jgi:long-chain alkane monooxygenase